MIRRLSAVLALGVLVPACGRSCTEMGYSDTLTMTTDLPSVADVVSVCIDDRCYRAPFDGSVAPDQPTLSRATPGSLVLSLQPGRLPNRAGTVRVTVAGGRAYEGRAERPISVRSPNGKGCGPDQRTQVVTLV